MGVKEVDQVRFCLKSNPGIISQANQTVLYWRLIGESAKWLKYARIRFVPTKPQASCQMKRELMSTMGNTALRGPVELIKNIKHSQIFDESVSQRRIHLQVILLRSQSPVA